MTTGGSAIKVLMIIMVRSRPKNFFVDKRKPTGIDTKNAIKTALNDTLKEGYNPIFKKATSYINRSTNDGYKLFIYYNSSWLITLIILIYLRCKKTSNHWVRDMILMFIIFFQIYVLMNEFDLA